ncbi:LOW QUALITY PROTEIN: Hypothetical protein PHPALM_8717 [Phytophthora palmivora]|uniref:Uncharacterized protein n=1 Tax=Phytophthora palmivora TaxID=4796 RepID=A0A2P4Y962_9STRA|nr:LOW QUALITY PROTEIN: Hypothetical protein PHPALM_8717 [Phytophthora palmivora]
MTNGFPDCHLTDKPFQHVEDYKDYGRGECTTLDTFGFVADYVRTVYHWIRCFVERNITIEQVDNKLTRDMSRRAYVSSLTLKKKAIAQEISDSSGIMFDGWSAGSTYYVGVYAIYVVEDSPCRVFLALAPHFVENDLGADSHIAFITEALAVLTSRLPAFDSSLVTTTSPTRLWPRESAYLFICTSHRLDLAFQQHAAEYESLLSQVNEMMCQLQTETISEAEQSHLSIGHFVHNHVFYSQFTKSHNTELRPIKTRWSSSFKIINRVLQIKDAVKRVEAVEEPVSRARDCRELTRHEK